MIPVLNMNKLATGMELKTDEFLFPKALGERPTTLRR